MSTEPTTRLPTSPPLPVPTGAAIDDSDRMPTEREAMEAGLALLSATWGGESDFDQGMRLLQKAMMPVKSNLRRARKTTTPGTKRRDTRKLPGAASQ